ncbi:MAG: carbamoyl-phosphate synthase large subunit [Acidobacteriia bacterium]|nr:carbamoyl-phosphate synthase large subunit [Terriglobia bacterium]
MQVSTLLIANRGEIAVRIARAAAELGIRTVAIFSEDDALSLHVRKADEARPLDGIGPAAYLDSEQILKVARDSGCDAIHPGYGFLSENAGFARRCAQVGLAFVGPRPEILELFGDKAQARALAARCGVPLLAGTNFPTSVEEAKAFLESLGDGGAIMIKAIAGGGGRGMRAVSSLEEIEPAFARCRSEALKAFGNADLYVEQLATQARHIEIQIIGDGKAVTHLGERDCSIQRQHQKIIEIAPSPGLSKNVRGKLTSAALRLAQEACYNNAGTFEFLVYEGGFAFLEANPRLQVEHTITEELTGIDLVKTQLQLARGCSLAELELHQADIEFRRGFAMELRINLETMDASGRARPTAGTLTAFEPPSGPGIRVDSFGYAGYSTNPSFDSLLAKLIGYSPSPAFADAVTRAYRALCEFRVEGVATNIPFLQHVLQHPDFRAQQIDTRFVDDRIADLTAAAAGSHQKKFFAGATGVAEPVQRKAALNEGPPNTAPIAAHMQGTVVSVDVAEGDAVRQGQQVAVLEAMKMEHIVKADRSGFVRLVNVAKGEVVFDGHPLVFLEEAEVASGALEVEQQAGLDHIRPDLAETIERHSIGLDERRPDAVARRRKTGQRTARENIADLCDPGSFSEYGSLAIAAQRKRRSLEDLMRNTPADGLVACIGTINGALFDQARARAMVMSYDYTVLAGTQGSLNHKKTDRLLRIAEQWRLPLVLFAEGGGGRPGDTDALAGAHLDVPTFFSFAKLSGLVPLVGVVSGRCFAGNASLLGCCDVIIATENSSIGMAGPAMIEGGGLGVVKPEEVGPIDMQTANGVVDVAVADEAEAVAAAKKYLSYFQGPLASWEAADQRLLRQAIPENRLRVYDVRRVIDTLADTGSVLELRPTFGIGMITAFIRVEGRPLGLIANNPKHLAGAIDPEGADKAARHMQLCDAFGIPILSLCDTPGFMVGPDIEKKAQVRHTSRMFVTGASLTVPYLMVVLRKGYGLGAQAMAGGCFHAPLLNVSWPTGEFGGMGLEGAVKLGYRKELEAIQDPKERQEFYEKLVAKYYETGKALNVASFLEFDDVIDPAQTRECILRALKSLPAPAPAAGKRRPFIDAW